MCRRDQLQFIRNTKSSRSTSMNPLALAVARGMWPVDQPAFESAPPTTGSRETTSVPTNLCSGRYPVPVTQSFVATACWSYNNKYQLREKSHSLRNMTRCTQKSMKHALRYHPREKFIATRHYCLLHHVAKQTIKAVWSCRMRK